MSNQIKWALGILIGAVAIAALMIILQPEPEQEVPQQLAPLVQTVPLTPATGAIPVSVSGTVQPRDEIVISPQVSGRLTYVNPTFREGQFVQSNSILLRIDPVDFENQVRIAQADVAAQEVAVLEAREEVEIARDDLAKFAQREGERERLSSTIDENDYAARFLPPTELSQSTPANASMQVDGAAGAERTGLATREPQLRSAEAARDRAAATLTDAQTALNRTRISVPFSGLVREETASVGSLVQVGQALGTVASTAAYEVRLFLTEDEAALIPGLLQRSGEVIRADVFYDYGGLTYRWPAVVDRADASLDETTRNVEVFLRVPNPLSGGRLDDTGNDSAGSGVPPLLLGAFVRAQINGQSIDTYAEVPASALRPGNEIWVVRGDKLHIMPVRVIQRTDEFAYVTSASIGDGGRLVTSSLGTPTDGMTVRMSGENQ